MKKIMPIVLLVALLAGGYYVWTEVLGGSLTGSGPTKGLPTERPDLPDPGDVANDGAEGAQKGANWLADFLTGLSPTAWRMVAIGIGVGAIWWIIKNPKRRALAFGLVIIALLVFIIGGGS